MQILVKGKTPDACIPGSLGIRNQTFEMICKKTQSTAVSFRAMNTAKGYTVGCGHTDCPLVAITALVCTSDSVIC